MDRIRAFVYLVSYSFRRQLGSRKTLLAVVLLAMIAAVVFFVGFHEEWTARSFGEWVVLRMFGLFYLPFVCLMFGTGALGDDRDERSLVYLLTRPFARWTLFVGKLLGVLPYVLVLGSGALLLLHGVASMDGASDLAGAWALFLPGVLFGSIAYASFFHFLGAVFRQATLASIVYVFLVEVALGSVPGIMKRVSISFYTWSMLYEDAASTGLKPSPIFLPIASDTARLVLVGAALAFTLLGAWMFTRREYHDAA